VRLPLVALGIRTVRKRSRSSRSFGGMDTARSDLFPKARQ
jgi:hypothetical protein